MMLRKNDGRPTDCGGGLPSDGDRIAPIGKYAAPTREMQAALIRTRIVVSQPLARVIAEHAFGHGGCGMTFDAPTQAQLEWLIAAGVAVEAMIKPEPLRTAVGRRAADGRFEPDPTGDQWIVFQEPEDMVFWQPRSDELATELGRAFALGEAAVGDSWTYSFDGSLNVFASPLQWLRAGRDGIVIIDWSRTWSRLQDCPQIAVDRRLMNRFKRYCRPPYIPRIIEIEGKSNA